MQLKVEMQEVLLAKEEQEEVLRRRERELTALKGALKEEVAVHDQEVDKMKEQYVKEISKLQTSLEEAKQVMTGLPFDSLSPFSTFVPSPSFPSLSSSPSPGTHPVADKHSIRGIVTVCVWDCCAMFVSRLVVYSEVIG